MTKVRLQEKKFYGMGLRTAMPIIMAKTDKALLAKIHVIIRYQLVCACIYMYTITYIPIRHARD
jgi:hypothetical protein